MSIDKSARVGAIIKLVAFSVTLVILLAILGVMLVGDIPPVWSFSGVTVKDFDRYDDTDYAIGDQSYTDNIKNIDVDWVAGSITLEIYDGDAVVIKETGASSLDESMRSRVVGDTLSVKFARSGNLFWSNSASKDLTVSIPAKIAGELCNIDISSVSGDVTAVELVCDKLTVVGTSAKIDISGKVGKLDVATVSGDVKIVGTVGEVEMEAVSGSVNVVSDAVPTRVDIETVSGKIIVKVPSTADGFIADLDSISGNMSCNNVSMRYYKHGDGVARFDFETISGNVYVSTE